MTERGLTQSTLASELGVTQGAVSGWCRGAIPKGDQLYALARFFGVTMEAMLMNQRGPQDFSLREEPAINPAPDKRTKEAKVLAEELDRIAGKLRASFGVESHGRHDPPKSKREPVIYPKGRSR